MSLLPHQIAVVNEAAELRGRLARLRDFVVNGTVFPTLDRGEQSRMRRQMVAMTAYLQVLNERIEHF